MNKKTNSVFLVLLALLLLGNSNIKTTIWENLFQQFLSNYQAVRTPEKIYIHTDKSTYINAETVWLKGYIVEGINHTPTPLSKTVYVELWNEKAEKIATQILPVDSGVFVGNLVLPATLPSQTCVLRAYTNWQRNFDETYLFQKSLQVVNLTDQTAVVPQPTQFIDSLRVHFFPEGGNFVANLPNHLAFKLTTARGKSMAAKASLRNHTQQIITTCNTIHEGMGTFDVIPTQENYYLQIDSLCLNNQWRTPLQCGITTSQFPLPKSQTEGITLQVNNLQNKEVLLQVQGSATWLGQSLRLVAQCQGQLLLTSEFVLKKPYNLIKLPKNQLRTGIVQLTLFNDQQLPLAERLVFIHLQDQLQLNLQNATVALQPRKQASFTLKVQTTDSKATLKGNFSVAIVRKDSINDKNSTNHLLSELLLNNELRGEIYEPSFYFKDQHPKTLHCLDVLLQTQGWRRFVWKELTVPNFNTQLLPYIVEQGIVESGTVIDNTKKNVPFAKVSLLALLPNGSQEVLLVEADGEGNFSFTHQFPVGTELLISGKNGQNNYQIVWKEATSIQSWQQKQLLPKRSIDELPRLFVTQQQKIQEIHQRYKLGLGDQDLQEVTVIGKKEVKTPRSVNIEAFGKPEQRIVLEGKNIDGISNIADYLKGRVSGLQVIGGRFILRGVSSINGDTEASVVLDGLFLYGASVKSTLDKINPQDIASIEIYKGASTAIFGARGANGVIAITTKKGGNGDGASQKTVSNYQPKSYSIVKEFYTPDYSQENPLHSQLDYRSTVFWLPILKTNEKGEAVFSFYNGDDVGKYQIVIEGMTTEGKMGRLVQEIESR